MTVGAAVMGAGYRPAWLHADAYSPLQICSRVQKPSATTVFLTLSLVTDTGVSRMEGTSLSPLLVVAPWVAFAGIETFVARSNARTAASSASGLIALYTVMYWSPVRMRWMAANSASCPVTGGQGLTPAAFIAAIAPPAVPSLAAYTPSTLFPSAVSAWVISFWAWSGLQSGVSYSRATCTLPSRTLCAPRLNRVALLSVGEPLIITIDGLFLPWSACSSDVPCSTPTRWLSN